MDAMNINICGDLVYVSYDSRLHVLNQIQGLTDVRVSRVYSLVKAIGFIILNNVYQIVILQNLKHWILHIS